jgi:hypothetical protein
MKQIYLLTVFLLTSIILYSQENLNTGFSYSFIDNIPTVGGITTDFNDFKFDSTINHFLDKESGAITCIQGGNHKIEINLDNIGRLVFYTKVNLDEEVNQSLGNYTVSFFRDEKLIKSEKRDLSQNWTEFHFNINEYKINRIVILFNPNVKNSVIALDKMKIRTFTNAGVIKLRDKFEENELLKTVSADFNAQKNAIINQSVNNIKTLIYFKRKLDDASTFIEGEKLGSSRQKALNPFSYSQFDNLFNEIVVNASRAEKLKLDELKTNINQNNWVNVVGNVTDVLTGGLFNNIINSLKSIINKGVTIGTEEVIVLNGKLYKLSSGKLRIIPEGSDLELKYLEIHKKYSDYINFIEILSSKQLIEIKEEEKFDIATGKMDLIKLELHNLLSDILSNADLTIEDGFFKDELDSETLISKFRSNFSISSSDFLNYKIKTEISSTKTQNISSSFYEFISEFKTHYDNKYSLDNLDPKSFDELNIDAQIKKDWKDNLETITEQYINSTELTKLKNLSKE